MIVKMERSQTYPRYPRNFDFVAAHPGKVSTTKIFSMKDMFICSTFIFIAGISLGVGIMQYFTQ